MARFLVTSLFVLSVILMVGCSAAKPRNVTLHNQFNQDEMQALLEPGNNTIKGSGVVIRNNGDTVTTAGRTVDLIPVTVYSTERIVNIYGSPTKGAVDVNSQRVNFVNDSPNYRTTIRSVIADAQGFFEFDNVKDGEYYITTAISWSVSQYGHISGALLMQRVAVKGGETKKITLAP